MNVEVYDFRRPPQAVGGLQQRVTAWIQTACKRAGKAWGRHLPFAPELTLQCVEVLPPAMALPRLPETTVGQVLTLGPGGASSLLAWPRPLAQGLVAAMLGEAPAVLPADRELTIVEQTLLQHLIKQLMLPILQESWPAAEPLTFTLGAREPSPRWTRLFVTAGDLLVCCCRILCPFGEADW